MSDYPFAPLLLDWYARCGRDLPWRHTRDPYRIWLSEVILQQTRVAQGMAYYERFTERFPTVAQLAAATEDEVLKCWQGLGYYSRARNLHAAAREVVTRFEGDFPTDYEALLSLRGVGEYTAAAVASFSSDAPCAVVDGNVYRVLSRLFDLDIPINTPAGHREFARLADQLLDRRHPARYNQALMDFGAVQCTPRSPRCEACPLSEHCLSLAAHTVALRPVKQGHTKVRERWFNYLHITCGQQTLLRRRGEGDIWQGLYEFPMIETPETADFESLADEPLYRELLDGSRLTLLHRVAMPPHQLTHQRLHACIYRIEVDHLSPSAGKMAVDTASIGDYALPRLLDLYLTKYQM